MKSSDPNFEELLPLLLKHQVKFILIGGGAAMAHGSARATYDVDVEKLEADRTTVPRMT